MALLTQKPNQYLDIQQNHLVLLFLQFLLFVSSFTHLCPNANISLPFDNFATGRQFFASILFLPKTYIPGVNFDKASSIDKNLPTNLYCSPNESAFFLYGYSLEYAFIVLVF